MSAIISQSDQIGAARTQTVSFAHLTTSIDAGTQPIGISARLGGTGPGTDGMELSVQPQDADGAPLGVPTQLGPPTSADRGQSTTQLECRARPIAPVGTRTVLVTLRAVGVSEGNGALADQINIADELYASTVDYGDKPAQGPNCLVRTRSIPPDPAPAPTPGPDPAPAPPAHPAKTTIRAAAQQVRLNRTRLALYVPSRRTLRVTVARANSRTQRACTRWVTVSRLKLRADKGSVRRAFRHLRVARYRVTITHLPSTGEATFAPVTRYFTPKEPS